MIKLIHGDNQIELAKLPENSVDSIVTDPPYGLKFMGKKWDYQVPTIEQWRQVLRVLKPGGHLLSFGGSRTYHRVVVNIEDAGFEIRDQLQWLYGSGFPKSHNVSKGIDKKYGVKREYFLDPKWADKYPNGNNKTIKKSEKVQQAIRSDKPLMTSNPATDLAKQWDGWGTALKPAFEPIVLARKPLSEGTIVANVLKWGTGGINIDACRIEVNSESDKKHRDSAWSKHEKSKTFHGTKYKDMSNIEPDQGRFPANIMFDDQAAAILDEQSGHLKSGSIGEITKQKSNKNCYGKFKHGNVNEFKSNEGGASRFFYVAKASKKERGEGNDWPTVKPLKLMSYLIRLVTPVGGIICDPWLGSGSTGVAADDIGFNFIGIDRDDHAFEIAQKRIGHSSEE